jgi:hypothetical protein
MLASTLLPCERPPRPESRQPTSNPLEPLTHMTRLRLVLMLLSFLLVGCGTSAPVIDRRHPASAEAAESTTELMPRMLAIDDATRRTRDLLAQRAAEAKAAESETGAGTPTSPGGGAMDHSGHQMPGMKQGAGHENH